MLRELLEALMGKRSKKKRKNKKRRQFQDLVDAKGPEFQRKVDQRAAQDKRDDPAWRIADRMAKASREAAERHQGGGAK